VQERPDIVMQRFMSATAGAKGYSATPVGLGSLQLTRKYTPMWAVVAAIVGVFFFLLGILFLLFKTSETLNITMADEGGTTRVNISGLATADMAQRLNAAMSQMPG